MSLSSARGIATEPPGVGICRKLYHGDMQSAMPSSNAMTVPSGRRPVAGCRANTGDVAASQPLASRNRRRTLLLYVGVVRRYRFKSRDRLIADDFRPGIHRIKDAGISPSPSPTAAVALPAPLSRIPGRGGDGGPLFCGILTLRHPGRIFAVKNRQGRRFVVLRSPLTDPALI